jgi:hypothetical protein
LPQIDQNVKPPESRQQTHKDGSCKLIDDRRENTSILHAVGPLRRLAVNIKTLDLQWVMKKWRP